jgi:vancomycin resistance protein YoaR
VKRRAFLGGSACFLLTRGVRAEARPGVLGQFRTSYATDAEHRSRASNVQLAAEAIDGKKLAPGAVFSFNDAVGERTAAFGYSKAVVLRDGLIAEGMGGGACQVASTLYAAALLTAALDVKSRAPHSRPSAYIRMGFDATVSYPKIDLKLVNVSAEEVVIRARAGNGNLEVAIEGKPYLDVELRSEILDRTPFTRTLERDAGVGADEARRTAFGIPGYRVRRVKTFTSADGMLHSDVRIDLYSAVPEVLRVAPGFDPARLSPPEDEEHEAMAKVKIVNAPEAVRPLPVQLRPSTLVTLQNR